MGRDVDQCESAQKQGHTPRTSGDHRGRAGHPPFSGLSFHCRTLSFSELPASWRNALMACAAADSESGHGTTSAET